MVFLKNALSVLFWVPTFAVRGVLFVVGLVVVPFTRSMNPIWGNNEYPFPPEWFMPKWSEGWRRYAWRALRNPVNNMRFWFDEPRGVLFYGSSSVPEVVVRESLERSAWRFARGGLFSEFWYLRRMRDGEIFEFRIGWKFSEVPGFGPTLQLRKGK